MKKRLNLSNLDDIMKRGDWLIWSRILNTTKPHERVGLLMESAVACCRDIRRLEKYRHTRSRDDYVKAIGRGP